MNCKTCKLPLGISRKEHSIKKHCTTGFILLTETDGFHVNNKCFPDFISKNLLNFIDKNVEYEPNNNIEIQEFCPVILENFNDNHDLKIIIPPCNHCLSLEIMENLIKNNKPCPICRDKTFIGINKIYKNLDKTLSIQPNSNTNKRISSNSLARSASLAPCIPKHEEIYKEKGHFNDIPLKNDISPHMELRKKYLNNTSINDVQEVQEYNIVKLPIYILTLTQKSSISGFNDLVICILEKNTTTNKYELFNNHILNFNYKELNYKSLKLKHSGDPSDCYLPNYGGYCKGPNNEDILDHRILISSDNENITNINIHNLDIPYLGNELITSNKRDARNVDKEFLRIANELELHKDSNILILVSQITFNDKTLRELSTPCIDNHVSIQPSCSVLTTSLNNEKKIKIAPWDLDETYMNTYLAIELKHL